MLFRRLLALRVNLNLFLCSFRKPNRDIFTFWLLLRKRFIRFIFGVDIFYIGNFTNLWLTHRIFHDIIAAINRKGKRCSYISQRGSAKNTGTGAAYGMGVPSIMGWLHVEKDMVKYLSVMWNMSLTWKQVAFRRFIRIGLTLFWIQNNSKRSWKCGEDSETDNFQLKNWVFINTKDKSD